MALPEHTPVTTHFLTIEEAAQVARVTDRTLRRWVATGRLPYYQATARSRVLIKPDDLERYLTRHEPAVRANLDHTIDSLLSSLRT